jgi:hypothetical protein
MFHVYNKFDSMDMVHVSAKSPEEAIKIAVADGYLTKHLGVNELDIVAHPFSSSCQTSKFVRRINSSGDVVGGF